MDVVDQTKPTPRVPRLLQGYSGAYPARCSCGIMQRQFLPTIPSHMIHDAFCNVRGLSLVCLDNYRDAFCNIVMRGVVESTTVQATECRGDAKRTRSVAFCNATSAGECGHFYHT